MKTEILNPTRDFYQLSLRIIFERYNISEEDQEVLRQLIIYLDKTKEGENNDQ